MIPTITAIEITSKSSNGENFMLIPPGFDIVETLILISISMYHRFFRKQDLWQNWSLWWQKWYVKPLVRRKCTVYNSVRNITLWRTTK